MRTVSLLLCLLLPGLPASGLLFAEPPLKAPLSAAEEAKLEERYEISFYGLRIPEQGANVLLILDTSRSMNRKDATRKDGGTRWMTLKDEVRKMAESMAKLAAKRRVFNVTFLFEGGKAPHPGTDPLWIRNATDAEKLLAALEARGMTSGGSFDTTFGETLWPLVAKQHITDIYFLGDNDIATYADRVKPAVQAWYTVPRRNPTKDQKPLWELKNDWIAPWLHRPQTARGAPSFRPRKPLLPPPPKRDVTFSCIAIGQTSPFLKTLTDLGHGQYTERLTEAAKKRARKN